MTTRIIIRGAAEIEIILPAGVEPPTVGIPAAVAGEASTGTVRSCTASSPGSPKASDTDESCGGGESRPTGPTASLDCGGGPAQVKTASEVSVPSKDGRALDGRRCNSAPEQSGLGSATCGSGGTAGVAPGPHDTHPTVLDEPTVVAMRDGKLIPGGSHVNHQDDSPVEISAAIVGGATNDESPAAGEKAAHTSGDSHDAGLTAEPEVPSLGPPVTIPAISDEVAMERMLDAAASWNDALRRARA